MDNTGFTIHPKFYDFLKYIALVILPAVAALVIGLGITLNWSSAPIVAGVITLVDTFLGTILGKSASNHKKQAPDVFADLVVLQEPDGSPVGMKLVGQKENPVLVDGSQVLLNVRREQILE